MTPDQLDLDAVPPGVALACVAWVLLCLLAARAGLRWFERAALRHYLRNNREE